jgi:hypothetical protein
LDSDGAVVEQAAKHSVRLARPVNAQMVRWGVGFIYTPPNSIFIIDINTLLKITVTARGAPEELVSMILTPAGAPHQPI